MALPLSNPAGRSDRSDSPVDGAGDEKLMGDNKLGNVHERIVG